MRDVPAAGADGDRARLTSVRANTSGVAEFRARGGIYGVAWAILGR